MPFLHFKGKPFLKSYHHTVKFHRLIENARKSTSETPSLDDNLIIHGDNLKALKALLPTHAGKVKCIYIDPPYNTGNEGWAYNDNVNSPMIQTWLGQVVAKDDLSRHDKWCCMMYPRLVLLRELLREDGVIFVSIDDNEVHHLRMMMDEIFGEESFIAQYIWEARAGRDHTAVNVSTSHEYVLAYAKSLSSVSLKRDERTTTGGNYEDKKGRYRREQLRQWGTNDKRADRPTMFYPVTAPDGSEVYPIKEDGTEGCWRISSQRMTTMIDDGDVDFVSDGTRYQLYAKKRDGRVTKTAYGTLLQGVGTSSTGTLELKALFEEKVFDTVKPLGLITYLADLVSDPEAIILDSFAGSGTTAHAVMALNKEDGGNRKFILVECEDYADTITAERVRRVSRGVPDARDETLRDGLGGTFSFYELGDPIDIDAMLDGTDLPSFADLAKYAFHTATGEKIDLRRLEPETFYIGASKTFEVFLVYEADPERLKALALNSSLAEAIQAHFPDRRKLVFAPCCYLEDWLMGDLNITFAQLPFEIYRLAA